jgi:Transglycosylase SLT domain/SPOR domain
VPCLLLQVPLVVWVLVTDGPAEPVAASSRFVTSRPQPAEQEQRRWRSAESRDNQSAPPDSSPEFVPRGRSEPDSEANPPGSSEANPPGPSELLPGRGRTAAISIERMCQTIEDAARANELPVEFLTHLIWQESRFNPQAVSHAGAQGIAQFMPKTAVWRGLQNPFEPVAAILKSAELLRDLMKQFGNLGLAAAAYNAGPKRVQDWVERRAGLPQETEAYVRIITGHSADEWRAKHLIALNPAARDPVPCPTIAEGWPPLRTAAAPAQQEFAWGVQLIGSGSEAAARAAYQEMQKRYALLLAAHQPLVLRTSLGKASSWYRVRVGTATRASAEALCAKLRASGGSCLVQRN